MPWTPSARKSTPGEENPRAGKGGGQHARPSWNIWRRISPLRGIICFFFHKRSIPPERPSHSSSDSLEQAGSQLADRKTTHATAAPSGIHGAPRIAIHGLLHGAKSCRGDPAGALPGSGARLRLRSRRKDRSANSGFSIYRRASSRPDIRNSPVFSRKDGRKQPASAGEGRACAIVRDIRSKKKAYLAKIGELESARKKLDQVIKTSNRSASSICRAGRHPQPGCKPPPSKS